MAKQTRTKKRKVKVVTVKKYGRFCSHVKRRSTKSRRSTND